MGFHVLRTQLCRTLVRLSGHRLCCNIPDWLAGRRWQPVDVKPWNAYNVVWRLGQFVSRHGEG